VRQAQEALLKRDRDLLPSVFVSSLSLQVLLAVLISKCLFPLYEKDREAIKTIGEYYGIHTDADAIGIALHELERLIKGATPPQPQSPK
jgi:hypothetical protein